VNAFPPLHAFNSSRSWFLAVIVLVHLGFFWALTSGLAVYVFPDQPQGQVVWVPSDPPTPPPEKRVELHPIVSEIFIPPTEVPELRHTEESNAPTQVTRDPPPPPPHRTATQGPGEGPRIIEPRADARFPFTQPEYPVSEIRQQHEGTVMLRVQILPTGRVGTVEIAQSSGYVKLDESAAREARKWRMKPGTHDGVATAMYLSVPVRFQLKN
jgi:protein TonB